MRVLDARTGEIRGAPTPTEATGDHRSGGAGVECHLVPNIRCPITVAINSINLFIFSSNTIEAAGNRKQFDLISGRFDSVPPIRDAAGDPLPPPLPALNFADQAVFPQSGYRRRTGRTTKRQAAVEIRVQFVP
ncbi:hypothetical protein ACFYU5_07470 [Nocardia aobensis]|uniref:Uncharacterized protein n=1 Tax=Nocardia aobensis TaxID=257277 RepID=A0ABW6NYT4_9NOCA